MSGDVLLPGVLPGDVDSNCSWDKDMHRAMLLQVELLNTGKASQGRGHNRGSTRSCTDSSCWLNLPGPAAAAAADLDAVCAPDAGSTGSRGVTSPEDTAAGGTACHRRPNRGCSRSSNCVIHRQHRQQPLLGSDLTIQVSHDCSDVSTLQQACSSVKETSSSPGQLLLAKLCSLNGTQPALHSVHHLSHKADSAPVPMMAC